MKVGDYPTRPLSLIPLKGKRFIDTIRGQIITINNAGYYILSLCDGQHSVEDIKELVAKRYKVPVGKVDEDVKKFLSSAHKEGLIMWEKRGREGCEKGNRGNKEVNTKRAIYWEITRRCNLRCKHCYAAQPLSEDLLSLKEVERISKEAKDIGFAAITLTGGEPLLREDIWEIIEIALKYDMKVSLVTNATLISNQIASKLAKLPLELQLSMDGPTEEIYEFIRGKGSFSLFMKGLESLLSEGLACRITLAYTIMKPNIFSIDDFLTFGTKIGIKRFHFSWLQYQGNAKLNWDHLALSPVEVVKFAIKLHKYTISHPNLQISGNLCKNYLSNFTNPYLPMKGELPCPIGYNPYIDGSGWVYGCQLLSDPNFRLGNCREASLRKILEPSNILRRYQLLTLHPWQIPKCERCRYLPFCRGGCPAEAISVSASPLATSPSCNITKAMFHYFIKCLIENKNFISGKTVANVLQK